MEVYYYNVSYLVAPRSKMNQQRARRFKSSQDSIKIHEIEESLAKEHGIKLRDHSFDSNVISPGFFIL
jgi:5'-3' exonuclease